MQCSPTHKPINYGHEDTQDVRKPNTFCKYTSAGHFSTLAILLAKSRMFQIWLSFSNVSGVLIQ